MIELVSGAREQKERSKKLLRVLFKFLKSIILVSNALLVLRRRHQAYFCLLNM